MKVRVHELAKKYEIKNKRVLRNTEKRYRHNRYISPI